MVRRMLPHVIALFKLQRLFEEGLSLQLCSLKSHFLVLKFHACQECQRKAQRSRG